MQFTNLLQTDLNTKHFIIQESNKITYDANKKPTTKGAVKVKTKITLNSDILNKKENEKALNLLKEKAPSVHFELAIQYDCVQK